MRSAVSINHSNEQEVGSLRIWLVMMGLAVVMVVAFGAPAFAQEGTPAAGGLGLGAGLVGLAAALAVGLGALGTAVAQARIGAAASGAMAERPEIGGRLLIFLALPETMIILGFLVAFFLINKI